MANPAITTAVIAGSTGLVGNQLLLKLLADARITNVKSVGRRKTGIQNPKLEEIVVPKIHEMGTAAESLKGELYFCCLGTTIKVAGSRENFYQIDHDAVVEFGKVAKSNGAKCFSVVTASGANANSMIFYNSVKGKVENSLRELGLNRLVIFHPSLLMGPRKEMRAAEQTFVKIADKIRPLLPSFLEKRAMTDADHLAGCMLELALQDGTGVQVLEAHEI